MPHAGLMNERELGEVDGPLQRARLHIRGGKRRLRQGKISAGIVTLYDALEAAMQYRTATWMAGPLFRAGENRYDDATVYAALIRAGVLDGSFDFAAFDRLTERALAEELPEYDYRPLLSGLDAVMTRLGVMPFDESALPPEDPRTF